MRVKVWCVTCKHAGNAGHVYTKGHRNALRPKVQRHSRLFYLVHEGNAPSWATHSVDDGGFSSTDDYDTVAEFMSLVRSIEGSR